MSGYLLDTNTLYALFDQGHEHHLNVKAAESARDPNAPLYVSVITLGEVLYGHAWDKANESLHRQKFRDFIAQLPQALLVSRHTVEPYAEIRAKLCQIYAPPGGWKKGKRRAEELFDPTAAAPLGFDENDLWLIAQAVERNLILVSADKMSRIKSAVASICASFSAENWCADA